MAEVVERIVAEAPPTPLDHILALAAEERVARDSPAWRTNLDGALDRHSTAVERLYDELYRLLDERQAVGAPVSPFKPTPPPDPAKQLRKDLLAHVRDNLPRILDELLDDLE